MINLSEDVGELFYVKENYIPTFVGSARQGKRKYLQKNDIFLLLSVKKYDDDLSVYQWEVLCEDIIHYMMIHKNNNNIYFSKL